MKLIDRDLVELSAQYGTQDTIPDPVVIARYICTTSPAAWLVTRFDPSSGYASGFRIGQGKQDDGWGLFNILELARMLIPTDTFFFENVVYGPEAGFKFWANESTFMFVQGEWLVIEGESFDSANVVYTTGFGLNF